jgi:hypothetical protein
MITLTNVVKLFLMMRGDNDCVVNVKAVRDETIQFVLT